MRADADVHANLNGVPEPGTAEQLPEPQEGTESGAAQQLRVAFVVCPSYHGAQISPEQVVTAPKYHERHHLIGNNMLRSFEARSNSTPVGEPS